MTDQDRPPKDCIPIPAKSLKLIERRVELFAAQVCMVTVVFPFGKRAPKNGEAFKRASRKVQRILIDEFQAKGYRRFEFSKQESTFWRACPHLHLVVDKWILEDKVRILICDQLGWDLESALALKLVKVTKTNRNTAKYVAKTRPEDKECNCIPKRFSSIKRVFGGFGWGRGPQPSLDPSINPPPRLLPGKKPFGYNRRR